MGPNRNDQAECAGKLKVLSDPTRLTVLQLLLDRTCCVAELNARLHVEPSLLSHHLSVLREAGWIVAQRNGRSILYSLAPGIRARGRGKAVSLGCCRLTFG